MTPQDELRDLEAASGMLEEMGAEPFDYNAPEGFDGGLDALKGFLRPSAGAGRTLLMAGAPAAIAVDEVRQFGQDAGDLFDQARGAPVTERPPVTQAQEWYFDNVVEGLGTDAVKAWTPDPVTMSGTAKSLNLVANVLGSIPQIVGTPGLFVANSGVDPAVDLVGQGVDLPTAGAVGAVNLAVNAVGMRLPAAFGTTLPTRLATGAGSNLVLGAGADAGSGALLDAGGYATQAQGFDAADPYARTLDVLMGLAFGAKAHIDAPRLSQAQGEAVLVARNADHLEHGSLPGEPLTPDAGLQSQTALATAIEQVLRGDRVNVADAIRPEDFLLKPELQTPAQLVGGNGVKAVQADFRAIAAKHGATITSMERGVIARGAGARSQHPHGTAADFRTRDKTPEQVEALMADLRAAGFEVIDERNTDQPHIHAELPPQGRRAQNIANAAQETNAAGLALRERLIENPDQLAVDYAALKDSEGGVVLNTDVARELSPEYLADRTRSADVHEAASDTIKTIYERRLAQPTPEGREPVVMFTAGGTGAGKTSAINEAGAAFGKPEIVYDTNMNTLSSAASKVEQALAAGRAVRIVYVYRDPVEALTGGAIPRAQRQAAKFGTGRTVPLAEHAKTHAGVRNVMEKLAEKYRNDPRVSIHAIDNSHGKGGSRPAQLEDLPKVEQNSLHERLQEALDQARTAGLDESLYRGFSAEGRADAPLAAGDGRQSESQRAPGEVTPETSLQAAAKLAAESPDLPVIDGFDADGSPRYRPMADAIAEIELERQRAVRDADGISAAVNCTIRRGPDAS